MNHIPAHVVTEDHTLEDKTNKTQEELARLRWHWTLDESNPDRVSCYRYAADIGRSESNVSRMAHGFAAFTLCAQGQTLGECIARAGASAEKQAAVEAVAKVEGKTYQSAARRNRPEVKEVLHEARRRAEKHGTTVEEEALTVAERRKQGRDALGSQEQRDKERTDLRVIAVLGHFTKAGQQVDAARKEIDGVPFDAEERELISDALEALAIKFQMVQASLADWDAELANITGE